MGGFVAAWLIPFVWVAAVSPAVNSKVPICRKAAPICSSTLYPLCVYSDDCKPDWACVSLSNLLQSIITKFRCFPINPGTDNTTKPYPTARKPKNSETSGPESHPTDGDDEPYDYSDESREPSLSSAEQWNRNIQPRMLSQALSQNESKEQAIRKSDDSVIGTENGFERSPSCLSIKTELNGSKPLNTVKSNPGNVIKDIYSPIKPIVVPNTRLELDQLFDSTSIPKISSIPQNRIDLDNNKQGKGQIDWSGLGSINHLPTGESRPRKLKLTVPESSPNVGTNFDHKHNGFAEISSVDSMGLGNYPKELEEPSPPSDSKKPSDLAKLSWPSNGKSKSHRKKALGTVTGSISQPNDPERKVNEDHKVDSSTDTKMTSQAKPVPKAENEGRDSQEFTEGVNKRVTKLIDSRSSEPHETDSEFQYRAVDENSSRLSLNTQDQKLDSLVKPMTIQQIEREAEPTSHPSTKSRSKTIVPHNSELPLPDSKGKGTPTLGFSLPEILEKNLLDNQGTLNKPRTSTTKNGSSNQEKNGSTVEAPSIQETNESSSSQLLLQPAQNYAGSWKAESHKYTETDSEGPPTNQSTLDEPIKNEKPGSGSSHKRHHKGHGPNRNRKHR